MYLKSILDKPIKILLVQLRLFATSYFEIAVKWSNFRFLRKKSKLNILCETPGEMHMSDVVVIDSFRDPGGGGGGTTTF